MKVDHAVARGMAVARMLNQSHLAAQAGRDTAAQDARIRAAAMRAPLAYPGVVGRWLADELDAYARTPALWGSSRMAQVMEDVLTRRIPA